MSGRTQGKYRQKEPDTEEYRQWKKENIEFRRERNLPLRLAEEAYDEERRTMRAEYIKEGMKIPPQYLADGDVRYRLTWMKGQGFVWKDYLVDHNVAPIPKTKGQISRSHFLFSTLPRLAKFAFLSSILYGGFWIYKQVTFEDEFQRKKRLDKAEKKIDTDRRIREAKEAREAREKREKQ